MKYGDINKAVTETLKDLYPERNVYSIMREEGIERPAFFFYLRPVIVEPANMRTRHSILSLYIDYFQEIKDEEDMYNTCSAIRDAFGFAYMVKDKYVNVTGFDWELVGKGRNVMQMDITLEFFEAIDNDEHADPMESVDVNVILKEVYK